MKPLKALPIYLKYDQNLKIVLKSREIAKDGAVLHEGPHSVAKMFMCPRQNLISEHVLVGDGIDLHSPFYEDQERLSGSTDACSYHHVLWPLFVCHSSSVGVFMRPFG